MSVFSIIPVNLPGKSTAKPGQKCQWQLRCFSLCFCSTALQDSNMPRNPVSVRNKQKLSNRTYIYSENIYVGIAKIHYFYMLTISCLWYYILYVLCQNIAKHIQGKALSVLSRGCTTETEVLSSATEVSRSRSEWKHSVLSAGQHEQSWRQSAQ